MISVERVAAARRAENARRITATLAVLTALAVLAVLLIGAPPAIPWLLVGTTGGLGGAHALARAGRPAAGIAVAACTIWVEQVAVVMILRELGPIPYLAPIIVLVVAATARSGHLLPAFLASLLALAAEAALSPWEVSDRAVIVAAGLLTATFFVVSLLHVRGTERAFAIAAEQDAARARAADLARETDERYRLIAENADELIALVDADHRALYLSPSHERRLGLNVEQALGGTWTDLLPLENASEVGAALGAAFERGRAQVEVRTRAPGEEGATFDTTLQRVAGRDGPLVVALGRDVTERRRLEGRLLAAERAEVLGRLAGGVAHDFNNLLTVIGGGVDLARSYLESGHPAQADLAAAMDATESATKLTRQLLTFSRKQMVARARLDLGAELDRKRELLERLVGRSVTLQYEFAADLPAVNMSEAHLEQLVMNLAVNARDAMPRGGRLRVSLTARDLGAGEVGTLPPGRYVELGVHDEGVGIPEAALARVFEPTFSTKGEAGTGLGLATCSTIVSQLGGHIEVRSEVGRGTSFAILLPAARGAEPAEKPSLGPGPLRHVLVVDDERAVRDTTERMLRASGYEVTSASSLREARRLIGDFSIPIDAVLTDVVLHEERGTDLLEDCRRLRPAACIVVMSGFAPDPGASAVLERHGAGFLAKPFTRQELLAALGR